MSLFLKIFGNRRQKILKTCTQIYNKAKKMRPDRCERDYLKIVLLTKPPFDYQHDKIIDNILDSCKDINDLSTIIDEQGKIGSFLWQSRERNIRLGTLKDRNEKFFSDFWR